MATAFESKYRAWILTDLYLLALACFRFNRQDIAFTLAQQFARVLPLLVTARICYFAAALLVFFAAFLRTYMAAYPPGNPQLYPVQYPGYLAAVSFFLGFGLLLNPLGFALLTAGMTLLIYRLLLRERMLQNSSVPSHRSNPPRWGWALLRCSYFWAFGFTLITLAITLQENAFYIALSISLLLQAASSYYFRQTSPRSG